MPHDFAVLNRENFTRHRGRPIVARVVELGARIAAAAFAGTS
jgi:hypothetical protein